LLPHELKDFGKSLIAVVTFVSNILFWLETDYFTADTELIPLLHTWSLAVEEQFYIIFPLFLALFARKNKVLMVTIVSLIALVSLCLTEWGWRYFAEGNFYLIPFRAWELMIGALVAFYLFYNPQPRGWICHLGSFVGLVLIIVALFFLDKNIPFPSVYALAPTLGTALIILFANPQTFVNKLLSFKLFVMVGLVSYSAYLWHQPLFVFARAYYMDMPSASIMAALSVVSVVLGYVSWRYIEAPFRDKHRFSQKQIFVSSLLVGVAFILIGVALVVSDGGMYRFE
jgi:peptidoglycan/LPS O-acetylase OafA/YrhL